MKLISVIVFITALKCASTDQHRNIDDKWCAESYKKNQDCPNDGACKFEVNNNYESNPNPNGKISSLLKTFLCIEK